MKGIPRERGAARGRGRGGFTLAELLVTMAVVGILAAIALPNLRLMMIRALAAEIAGDLEVVRVAAAQYHAERLTWPEESGRGEIPPGLPEYLPDEFSFTGPGYALDFENWSIPGGLPGDRSTTTLIGVSVAADDPVLADAIAEFLGSAVVLSVDDTHTVVIDRS